jgi:hypothetical protein
VKKFSRFGINSDVLMRKCSEIKAFQSSMSDEKSYNLCEMRQASMGQYFIFENVKVYSRINYFKLCLTKLIPVLKIPQNFVVFGSLRFHPYYRI